MQGTCTAQSQQGKHTLQQWSHAPGPEQPQHNHANTTKPVLHHHMATTLKDLLPSCSRYKQQNKTLVAANTHNINQHMMPVCWYQINHNHNKQSCPAVPPRLHREHAAPTRADINTLAVHTAAWHH